MADKALVAALIKAKAKFKKLEKDKVNPFFKSKYADLHTVYDSVDAALLSEGLVLVQPIVQENGAQYINSKLMHVSGEELPSMVKVPDAPDQQKFAASVTYLKRTAAQALLGIASQDEDDDGEEAVGRTAGAQGKPGVRENPTRTVKPPATPKDKPVTPPGDVSPNVLGKVTKMAEKITPAGVSFWEIMVEDTSIIMPKALNKAQEDLQGMILKDMDVAMQEKKTVEISFTMTGKGNKMFAGCKVYDAGEEPRL